VSALVIYIRQSSAEQVRDHEGSRAAQLAQAELARRWGWPESRIKIIERDLGLPGTSTALRPGFLEMLAMMGRGEIGMVMAMSVDRLNRKLGDFDNLLDLAADTETLLCIDGTVYDPASENVAEMLSLQAQAMFGAFDNRLRTRRFMSARIARAKQGKPVSRPPTGYLRAGRGEWIKDSDPRVQEAILTVFEQYPRLGSLKRVVRYFRENGLEFPRRVGGRLTFGPPDAAFLHSILTNPAYCGMYAFLRRQSKKRDGRVKVTRRPVEDWIVEPGLFPAYVSKELWDTIQEMLAARRPRMQPLIGKGAALLQGLIRCVECPQPMKARYWGRDGVARTASYACLRTNKHREPVHKKRFPALFIDEAVANRVLNRVAQLDGETAHRVIEAAQGERAALERSRHRRLQDAEDEVVRLRRFVLNTDPEYGDARADLMNQYNSAARRLNELTIELSSPVKDSSNIAAHDVPELIRRAHNVHQLWHSANRSHEDKKRLLRALISEVVVGNVADGAVEVRIVWRDNSDTMLTVRRARGVDAYVKEQTRAGKNAQQIADELNAAGTVTASGRPLSTNVILQKQGRLGIRLKQERLLARHIIRDGLLNKVPRAELLQTLNLRAPRLGPWDAQRLSNVIHQLRKGVPGIETLPDVLPAEHDKQAVIKFIDDALAVGKNWVTMAKELNESDHLPPRGRTFTPVQLRLLFMRSRGLRSFTLSSPPTRDGRKHA
jgi:DNA invertase Pin-like site-specific DNA recombinase/type III secretion system FlhB-like substrate exporter